MKQIFIALSLLLSVLTCFAQQTIEQKNGNLVSNPKMNEVSGEYYDWTKTMQPEHPWVRDYNQTLVMKMFLCSRDAQGKVDKVYFKFADALAVIRKLDNITLGLPKIVYLVGWQYNGHDSKYPALGEVNQALKREQDPTALESLQWLIREAKAYNTTVSLHINMIDAYEESPLWKEYFDNDIIAKDKQGKPIKGEDFGLQSYQISYAQEWKTGYAQKRIDGLIKMIPELKEGGTIHIDAFHSMQPVRPNEPISPYLGFTTEDEIGAQRKIMRYWRNQGIDVTAEGYMDGLRKDPFIGLQAMAWWYRENSFVNDQWVGKPDNFVSLPAQFSAFTPMHAEEEIKKDPENLSGLLEQFCLNVVPWYYKRNVDTSVSGDVIMTNDLVICPVLWKEKTMLVYTKQDLNGKVIHLPSLWLGVKEVELSELTEDGPKPLKKQEVTGGLLTLDIQAGQPIIITPIH